MAPGAPAIGAWARDPFHLIHFIAAQILTFGATQGAAR